MILKNVCKLQNDQKSRDIKLFCADAMLMSHIISWLLLGQFNDVLIKPSKLIRVPKTPQGQNNLTLLYCTDPKMEQIVGLGLACQAKGQCCHTKKSTLANIYGKKNK